jgi:hypothetical protein
VKPFEWFQALGLERALSKSAKKRYPLKTGERALTKVERSSAED